MKGFRLISIDLKENDEIDEAYFLFNNLENEQIKNPYTTLIIGPNGTGKGRLLRIILDIFNDLYNYQKSGDLDLKFKGFSEIIYSFNNIIYKVQNNKGSLTFIKGDEEVSLGINGIKLPAKVICASYSIYEKFTPKENEIFDSNRVDYPRKTRYENDFYEYLGVKTSRNYTFTSSYINRSIDLLTEAISEEGFSKDIAAIFSTLDFKPALTLVYRVNKNKELFRGDLSPDKLIELLKKITYQNSGFSFNSIRNILSMDESFIFRLTDSLNEVSRNLGKKKELAIDLTFESSSVYFFSNLYKPLSFLRKLNLINYSNIIVYKKSKRYPEGQAIDIKQMSSGEIQILTSMLALSAVVKRNSLVLIDEPEISMHPNWQMKYIDILNKIFKNLSDCHFVVASHSHFLVSDIKPESSSILSLTRDKNRNLIAENIDYNTYGWSVENILYNVFNVATVRNHYFEMDLRNLLKMISKESKDTTKIENLIDKLSKFKLHENDPLNLILQDAKEYVNNR